MNDTPDLSRFIEAAKEFCNLARAEGPADESDLLPIRNLLLRLLFHMPAVDAAPRDFEAEGAGADQAAYHRVLERFSSLPFNHYKTVFDPHDLEEPDEPVMGMLSDDLADIYRDLAEGLNHCERGDLPAACAEWSVSYRIHWARHAVSALAAIEIHRTKS
jgi:hypothetical protein